MHSAYATHREIHGLNFEIARSASRPHKSLGFTEVGGRFEVKHGYGWGGVFNPRTSRPWAVKGPKGLLTNSQGRVRTFGDPEAAVKAAISAGL